MTAYAGKTILQWYRAWKESQKLVSIFRERLANAETLYVDLKRDFDHVCSQRDAVYAPIPMILTCPSCLARHIDVGEFATKSHHTHACQNCGMVWRPAIVATVGVGFLPGYRDVPTEEIKVYTSIADALRNSNAVLGDRASHPMCRCYPEPKI